MIPDTRYDIFIYFLVDQGKINKHLEALFGIKTKFAGKMLSSAAQKLGMEHVTSTVNDKHVAPWSRMTKVNLLLSAHLVPCIGA